MDPTVEAAVISVAGTIVCSAVSAASVHYARHARRLGQDNASMLTTIRRQTAPRMDNRIRQAVLEVAKEQPGLIDEAVATEAVRDLLDAILGTQLPDDERRRLRHERLEG